MYPVIGSRTEPCGVPNKLGRPGEGRMSQPRDIEGTAREVGGQQESKLSMTRVFVETLEGEKRKQIWKRGPHSMEMEPTNIIAPHHMKVTGRATPSNPSPSTDVRN